MGVFARNVQRQTAGTGRRMNRLLICRTCRQESGSEPESKIAPLKTALRDAGLGEAFTVGTVDCMGACEQPVSLAFQGDNRASFVFSGVRLPEDMPDIVATARTYLEARDGWIEDALPCGRLRFCLRARIPALPPGDAG